jgi:hypothetical protein
MSDNQPMTSTPRRAVLYLRTATASRPDDQTIQRQRDRIEEAAAALCWTPHAIYTDAASPDETGSAWHRPPSPAPPKPKSR